MATVIVGGDAVTGVDVGAEEGSGVGVCVAVGLRGVALGVADCWLVAVAVDEGLGVLVEVAYGDGVMVMLGVDDGVSVAVGD